MSYRSRSYISIGPTLTPAVKKLVIVCAVVFLFQMFGAGNEMVAIFGLVPYFVLTKLFFWQLGTYLFLHGSVGHLFWNMFTLWMFGCELERYWGSREFVKFVLITGIGAGVLSIISQPFSTIPTIGVSGASNGLWVDVPRAASLSVFSLSHKSEVFCVDSWSDYIFLCFQCARKYDSPYRSSGWNGGWVSLYEKLVIIFWNSAGLSPMEIKANAKSIQSLRQRKN